MIYLLTSLALAMLFGVGAVLVYGPEGLLAQPWTDRVFWWLIGSGTVLALVDVHVGLRCLLCRLLPALPSVCSSDPCT